MTLAHGVGMGPGGGGGSGGGSKAGVRQSREALPLVEQPTSRRPMSAPTASSSSPPSAPEAPAARGPGVRTSMEGVRLRPIEEWQVTDAMPDHVACVTQLACIVRADQGAVRRVFQEIASSRARTSKIPHEVLAQDVVRAHRLLAASNAPAKSDSEFLDLMLGLGPVDPTDKRVYTVTPEEFTAALYDAANAVQLVYSSDASDRRRVADLLANFTLEAGRRQLDLQNKFREVGWNQGGEVSTRQLALVLAASLPNATAAEVRMALAYLDRLRGDAGRRTHTLEDVK